jgi:hypothetical protein
MDWSCSTHWRKKNYYRAVNAVENTDSVVGVRIIINLFCINTVWVGGWDGVYLAEDTDN